LPTTAGPGERNQARRAERSFDVGDLALATHETRHRRREVARTRIEGNQRREVNREPRDNGLVDALRLQQILQPPFAHVAQCKVRRQPVAER
jgi:hypothetical protein